MFSSHDLHTPDVFMNPNTVGLSNEVRRKFATLENQLSPENIHCDGEISHTQAMKKYRRLMKEWKALEKKYNVSVTPYV